MGFALGELLIVLALLTVLFGGGVGSLSALTALQLNADCTRVKQLLEGLRLRAVLLGEAITVTSDGRALKVVSDRSLQPRLVPLAYSNAEIISSDSGELRFLPDLYASPGRIVITHRSLIGESCSLALSLRGQVRRNLQARE